MRQKQKSSGPRWEFMFGGKKVTPNPNQKTEIGITEPSRKSGITGRRVPVSGTAKEPGQKKKTKKQKTAVKWSHGKSAEKAGVDMR